MKSKINLVTGGTGFLGSHLIDNLMKQGEIVFCLDNNFTGKDENIKHWIGNNNFKLIKHDVIDPIFLEVDRIWHLACPASPIHYQSNPIKTAKTSFLGTLNMLGLAKKNKAQILMASTSEIYGDPEIHPQTESYKGSVNPIGIRACYDEGKRISETLCFDYHREHKIDIKVMRIFNTYGPRMNLDDGRVISNFIVQSLTNKNLTIYGDGNQTRSFCYVDDLIDGMMKLMNSEHNGPVNIGNPDEYTINQIAETIIKLINPSLKITNKPLPQDDPLKRKPDINLANKLLNWMPEVKLKEGLKKTIPWFEAELIRFNKQQL
ncbi:SDR family oxidoreductase [Prochlorococcus marinus XMU1410]|uniref:UDP-glucuronic acid decarboxylase family protein n=1 Tax=Prochlorococcus marinus TaxID=1219 RepID=UPI001ADBFCB2|nr:UDP-glucuronic acid decarboxylase family protein [Prochlorococcus marinus]MBO8242346.1 SDR family oxidoreductase [Prochlorococcus marinus XMU1410]MBW3053493.1 NAD-dependent dehydratase [Prochlorococcus marinus str. MU1410]